MKIAQHFSAGIARQTNHRSPRSGRLNSRILLVISRPFHGLRFRFTFAPTDESVGYFHVVRAADENRSTFQAKPVQPLASAFANSNLTLVPELSLSIAPRMELITPALATVAE